ncbi:MAG: PDZ domain-containing protein [Thioalkalivibrio sp.]|nr:MAG: PDZ domain-containing protein [Thioalkalivibrio sp.]
MKALCCRRPAGLCATLLLAALLSGTAAADCFSPGDWRDTTGQRLAADQLFQDFAEADVVLLGERHDRMEHHRWQVHTLAALHAHRPDMVIGLEMLPRSAQPALDAWVAGDLEESAFLEESEWAQVWGFDARLYLPILHFARMHRVPLLAINLERPLIARIMREGWEAVPPEERYHITPPAPATEGYRDYLGEVFEDHPTGAHDGGELDRFVSGQLIWDRAMAAGLAQAAADDRFVVGLMGQGHLEYGYGVPHQLLDLGISDARVLLPWEIDPACTEPEPGVADAVFALAGGDRYEPPRPLLLGVRIEEDPAGVRVQSVMEDSVAAAAGLEADDVITRASDVETAVPGDLQAVVRRQQPGNVIPLTVLRDDEELELLARFPAKKD